MSTKRFLFQTILTEGIEEGFRPGATEESRVWFRDKAAQLKDIRPERVSKRPGAIKNQVSTFWRPGELYLFRYMPKGKDVLPYYDIYPLVMLLDVQDESFLGINFHYIRPEWRALLMDKMYRYLNNKNFDERTRLIITYEKLKILSGRPYYKPCIKRYLNSNVIGRFIKIHPAEWDIVLMLPLDRFRKARRNTVWLDSNRVVRESN